MPTAERLPRELAGKDDFDYITPKGRRLTEYEAVTVYTQPQVDGGGLQACGSFHLRPDGRRLFDMGSTRLRCADWFAYRDPNQMWQRPYYALQAATEQAIERATATCQAGGTLGMMEARWIESGIQGAYLPFSHYEYGMFRALNVAARESLSDTINSVLLLNAADKLRHAQAIAILGLDLESSLPGFDGTVGRTAWLERPLWQPLRQLVEEVMAIQDWGEAVVAVNLVMEPLIGEPMRSLVFGPTAARNRDLLTPLIATTASGDWHRNAKAGRELVEFLSQSPGGEGNAATLTEWYHSWQDRVTSVADKLFLELERSLDEPGLADRARTSAEDELRRVGADRLDLDLVSAGSA